jgi:hypothetical protein
MLLTLHGALKNPRARLPDRVAGGAGAVYYDDPQFRGSINNLARTKATADRHRGARRAAAADLAVRVSPQATGEPLPQGELCRSANLGSAIWFMEQDLY